MVDFASKPFALKASALKSQLLKPTVLKPSVLIVGCGDLGGEVARRLNTLAFTVFGLSRSAKPIDGVNMLQGDVTDANSLHRIDEVKPNILIYCVAANGQTDAQYQSHYVHGLQHILRTQINNSALKQVFFVSSTRVYGQTTDALLEADTPAIPADFGGVRLLEAEHWLLDFCRNTLHVQATVLRLSGIYGQGRLRMLQLAKTPALWPAQNSWSNRIHRDDAAAFMVHLIHMWMQQQTIETYYLVTDSNPTAQYEVLTWLAKQLGIEAPNVMPEIVGGKRLSNQRMLSTGFKLSYPDYQAGYATLLAM